MTGTPGPGMTEADALSSEKLQADIRAITEFVGETLRIMGFNSDGEISLRDAALKLKAERDRLAGRVAELQAALAAVGELPAELGHQSRFVEIPREVIQQIRAALSKAGAA